MSSGSASNVSTIGRMTMTTPNDDQSERSLLDGQLRSTLSRGRRASGSRTLAGVAALSLSVAGLAACGSDDEPQQPAAAADSSVPESTVTPRVGAALGIVNATYEYTIPDGAGAAIAAGAKRQDILPGSLTATVGESIRIVNNDRQGHSVGPWYVGPNETLVQQFNSPGLFEGECTVHDSGRFILQVVEG